MELLIWVSLGLSVWALRHSRRTRAELQQLREQVEDLLARQPSMAARAALRPQADAQRSQFGTAETPSRPAQASVGEARRQAAASGGQAAAGPEALGSGANAALRQTAASDADAPAGGGAGDSGARAALRQAAATSANPAGGSAEAAGSSAPAVEGSAATDALDGGASEAEADGASRGPQPPSSGPGGEPPASINWEQWIGVRGAAVVGGAVLALAGILFFKYSVEHNLVPPPVRVASGVLTGLALVLAGLRLPRDRYAITGDALVGGGLVALYAAFWAAHVLYHLIGVGFMSALLALTTVASGVLAVRLQARLVAVLGLVGGFITPLLLSTGHANPIGLFGYILLLDAGILVVARRLWPPLAALSLVGTVLYQVAWVVFSMRPEELLVGVGVLTVFAALYLLASPRQGVRAWWQTQTAAVLLPFLGALYLASRADMGEHFTPFGGMLLLLDAGVLWMGRRAGAFGPALDAAPWEPRRSFISMAAAANVAVFGTWAARNMRGDASAWEGLGIACAMAAVFCAAEIWQRRRPKEEAQDPFYGARLATCGLFVVTPFACIGSSVSYWPMVVAWLILSLLAAWLGNRPGQERLQTLAGGSLAAALSAARWAQVRELPSMLLELGGVWLGMAVLWSFLAQARRDAAARDGAERAVLAFVCVGLACFADTDSRVFWAPLPAALLSYGVLGAVGLAAASRSGAGGWGLACAVACAWAQGWAASVGESFANADPQQAAGSALAATFGLSLMAQLATLALFTLWPVFAGARAQAARWTWYTAAAASPLHLVPILLTVRQLTEAADGAVAVGLGACSLAALRALRRAAVPGPLLRGATAWIAAAALGMVSVALPLQLQDEWLLIGFALEGLAVTELWVRVEQRALKFFAAGLFIYVGARLVLGADEVYQFHTAGMPVLNFLMYTYWLPTASLVGAAWRAQASPATSPPSAPVFAPACGLAGLAVFFVWINLCIAQGYGAEHTFLSLAQGGGNALHLTQSVAWALYGLVILAAGVKAASVGLRWVSLGLLMVTAAKVFLFDLGDLEDLYRVASLVGLALSLITVSLCYQRFVFAPLREKKT